MQLLLPLLLPMETINNEAINNVPEAIYTIDGKRHGQMQRGLNIVRQANGRTVKVMKY